MRKLTRNQLATAGAVVVLLAGGAALAVALGDDGGNATSTGDRPRASVPDTTPATRPQATRPQATTSVPAGPVLRKRRRDRAERGIQKTVAQLVDGAERGDARAFCAAVGRPGSGSGLGALDACARAANVQLEALPTSDELSIEDVKVAGPRATVTLVAGRRLLLRRRGRVWIVASVPPVAAR